MALEASAKERQEAAAKEREPQAQAAAASNLINTN